MSEIPYLLRRHSRSHFLDVRGLRSHVLQWGDAASLSPQRPALVMLHGWMDVAASFQFVVDALRDERLVYALDWRGFGLSQWAAADGYWFPDYLGDLEAVLDALVPQQAVDLLGHSMGGNVAMIYAGVRPARVRRLINLEGYGVPASSPEQAVGRYAQWLDQLKQPMQLRTYDSLAAVAARLRQTNPLLRPERANWLAAQWARALPNGQWEIQGDPAHKRINPMLYQKAEVLECWKRIAAPVMWVEGDRTNISQWWGEHYPREEFEARLALVPQVDKRVVSPAGHMLHHDQPEQLAALVEEFLER